MQQYNLAWHTYSEHQREMMREMMICDDFKDVTLISDDKKPIKAHRNILSACSPVFKNIFQMEINVHPVIYLRGIKHSEIESILQFIYLGETKLYKDSLNELLLVAKNLEIEEFSKNVEFGKLQDYQTDNGQNSDLHSQLKENFNKSNEIQVTSKEESSSLWSILQNRIKSKSPKNFESEATKHDHLSKQIQSDKEDVEIQKIIEEDTKDEIPIFHIQSEDEGIQYEYNECDYQAPQLSLLKTHIESKHDGMKYECDQCDYQSTHKYRMKKHIQLQHENVKYDFNQIQLQHLRRLQMMDEENGSEGGGPGKKTKLPFTHHSSKFDKIQIYHPKAGSEVDGYRCQICKENFISRNKTVIKRHLQAKHFTVWKELEGMFLLSIHIIISTFSVCQFDWISKYHHLKDFMFSSQR